MFYDGLTNVLMKQSQEVLGTKPCNVGNEAMLYWERSYVMLGTKLCYVGDEAVCSRGRSYVIYVVML